MKVDLHIHSIYSDGTWGPEEILREVQDRNIDMFSVTDHDTMEITGKLSEITAGCGTEFVPGVEISSTWKGREVHITAYHSDPSNRELQELMLYNRTIRKERDIRVIKSLSELHPCISLSEFTSYKRDRTHGGWNSLNYLLEKKIISTLAEYFEIAGAITTPMQFPDPAAAIKTVKKAGGIPFLAHPGYGLNGKAMPGKDLLEWAGMGISGVECHSSYGRPDHAKRYSSFCEKQGLQISGGSDCHGTFLPKQPGTPHVTIDMLRLDF